MGNRQEIINKFKLLDFDERDMLNLFKDLEVSNDGLLSLEEFEHGLHSMQGDAKSKDMVRIQKAIERLEKHVHLLTNHCSKSSLEEGGASFDDIGAQTAFGKRKSVGRSRSPPRKSSPKCSQSPTSATCSTVLPSPAGTVGSVGSVHRSLPGLPEVAPAIRVDIEPIDLQRLDPSVRSLAEILVKH